MIYECEWRHGPSPGLTYYDGTITVNAENEVDAVLRARRMVAQKGCFDLGCIDIVRVTTAQESDAHE